VQFRPRIRVVAAGNPPEEAAGGFMLQPPMANRFAHRDVGVPELEEFTTNLLQGPRQNVEPIENGEKLITEEWQEHFPVVAGLMAGFVVRFKKIYEMPRAGAKNRGKAFLTPRTLEYAVRAVTAARILGRDQADQTEMFAACVGAGPAIQWEAWLREANLPHPLEVLQNGWKPDTIRLDRTMAVYSSISAYVTSRTDRAEKLRLAPLAWKRLGDLITANLPDMILPSARALVNAGFSTSASKDCEAAARPVMIYLGKKNYQNLVET
jgi:hypothetical protein